MKYEVWEKLAKKYNNLWVQKYSLGPTRREVKKTVVPLLEKNKDLKILDIGCGTGQLISEIKKETGACNYLGIDVAGNMIRIAKENNDRNLVFRQCAVEDFESQEKFDIVICTHSFPYFPDKEGVLKKISGLCNAGATLVIVNSSTNTLKDLIINFFLKATTSEAKYLSIKETRRLLKNTGFDVKNVGIIRERFYMPTIALFEAKKK